jgi:PPOX class probable F420-dependent enzyme
MPDATPFDDERYINLKSYRRDGSGVDTPVWCAPLDGKLVIFTLRESFKVKRIARNPRVQIAACDVRGKLRGEYRDATCRAVADDPGYERRAYAALSSKYGWQMRMVDYFSSLSGRRKRRLIMEIALA